ncbi:methyltransferase domain-containing protein [Nonomuraea sp. NPDC048916]|uniref:methyltransferase domain-containing protein n=1 Tax=Nonomuraea sp. NPDC048916 TaxID=3154232 RepID=UPI0034059C73
MSADDLADRLPDLDGRWREAMRAVPRRLFVPGRAWCLPGEGEGHLIDRAIEPDLWEHAVCSVDTAIVTQIDDGAIGIGEGGGEYTSSGSAPGVVAAELALLDPYDGDEVLEIGTGTGWTAALLAHRLGDANVTSVEIDPSVLAVAEANIRKAGRSPRLVLGDGTKGHPEGAPYDRVHVTCGVREVPYGWVEQTRPGGVIVLPWISGWEGAHLARLTATGDGGAMGEFHRACAFMPLRSQRWSAPVVEGGFRRSSTLLDPRRVVRSSYGAEVAIAGMLPGVCGTHADEEGGGFRVWLWSDDSEAHAHYTPDYKRISVWQRGPRDLWDEVEAAFLRWVSWGSPGRDRFGMTVTPEGQYIWRDTPGDPVSP